VLSFREVAFQEGGSNTKEVAGGFGVFSFGEVAFQAGGRNIK
jgi:hypothetical protein